MGGDGSRGEEAKRRGGEEEKKLTRRQSRSQNDAPQMQGSPASVKLLQILAQGSSAGVHGDARPGKMAMLKIITTK
jgi:hypothetical protein